MCGAGLGVGGVLRLRLPQPPIPQVCAVAASTLLARYTPTDSALFTKRVFDLTSTVFVEATEFADVILTSGTQFTQGFEVRRGLFLSVLGAVYCSCVLGTVYCSCVLGTQCPVVSVDVGWGGGGGGGLDAWL